MFPDIGSTLLPVRVLYGKGFDVIDITGVVNGRLNGSGTFVRSFNWVVDKTNAVNITASRMDTEMDGVAAGLTLCTTRDGQGKMALLVALVDASFSLGSASFRWLNAVISGNLTMGGSDHQCDCASV